MTVCFHNSAHTHTHTHTCTHTHTHTHTCTHTVTSFLYSFIQVLFEDSSQNRMQESLALFETILGYPWFQEASSILFLNKYDLFEEKVGKSHLSDYFPQYEGTCILLIVSCMCTCSKAGMNSQYQIRSFVKKCFEGFEGSHVF